MRIAVLGLGRMGAPMARNLAEIGHNVSVYNRTHPKAVEPGSTGVRVAATVADAVTEVQVALTMVSDDAAEEALTFQPDGLLAHLPAGAIHLCMSTIGVETSRRLAAAHEERGQGYVAAPVFGRPGGAASRHLWIVAGGPEAQVTRCLGIFDALGRGLTRVGTRPELAHAVKLGGNLLTAAMVEGLAEVLAFGEKMGLAPADFLRVMNTAIFKSPLVDSYGGLMVRRTFEPADLTLAQALGDTREARKAFEASAAPIAVAALLEARLEAAVVRGFGAQDLSALYAASLTEPGPAVEPPVPPSSSKKEPRARKRRASDRQAPEVSPAPAPEPVPDPVPVDDPVPKAAPLLQPIPVPVAAPLSLPEPLPVIPIQPETLPTPKEPPLPSPDGPLITLHGMVGNQQATLDLAGTTHFELDGGFVWAWHHGHRYKTSWRSLADVELAFRHVLFVRIQSDVLLQPETVLDLRTVFGGRAKVKVAGNLELDVSRSATPRLKELLGL